MYFNIPVKVIVAWCYTKYAIFYVLSSITPVKLSLRRTLVRFYLYCAIAQNITGI